MYDLDEDSVRPPVLFTSDEIEHLARSIHEGEVTWARFVGEGCPEWDSEPSNEWSEAYIESMRTRARNEARASLASFSAMGAMYPAFLKMLMSAPGQTDRQRARIRPVVMNFSRR